jgi:hypothetical protein
MKNISSVVFKLLSSRGFEAIFKMKNKPASANEIEETAIEKKTLTT